MPRQGLKMLTQDSLLFHAQKSVYAVSLVAGSDAPS